jgi:hypothetical protein
VSQDCLHQIFHESSSPKPLKITDGDIRKSRSTTGVNDTGGKFAIGNKFCHTSAGVVDTGGKQWEQYQIADNLK